MPLLLPISQFSSYQFGASGSVSAFLTFYYTGADGSDTLMNINAYGGISGYKGRCLALSGVFLSDATPQAPAPATLDFTPSGLGSSFLTLSPQIGQIFFIGDGITDGGLAQTFTAPAGATRLFLGFGDCDNALGDPGWYGDNAGSLSVTMTIVPEPASGALILVAVSLLGWRRCRRFL